MDNMDTLYLYKTKTDGIIKNKMNIPHHVLEEALDKDESSWCLIRSYFASYMSEKYANDSPYTYIGITMKNETRTIILSWIPMKDKLWMEGSLSSQVINVHDPDERWERLFSDVLKECASRQQKQITFIREQFTNHEEEILLLLGKNDEPFLLNHFDTINYIMVLSRRIQLYPYEGLVQIERYNTLSRLWKENHRLGLINDLYHMFPHDVYLVRFRTEILEEMALDPDGNYDAVEKESIRYPKDGTLSFFLDKMMDGIDLLYRPGGEKAPTKLSTL